MSEKIVVPALGESVKEATVSKWLKSVGEEVDSDEPLVELETDKVNVEVPSPSSGVLETIDVKEGSTVEVGALLGSVGENNSQPVKEIKEKKYVPPQKKEENFSIYEEEVDKTKINKKKEDTNGTEPLVLEKEEAEPVILEDEKLEPALILEDEHEEYKPEKKLRKKTASPSARKIAEEKNINLEDIQGSGRHGVVLKEDLVNLMGSKPSPNFKKMKDGPEERIKMTRLRLTIAKRLKEAQNNAAMLTTFNEVDMSAIIQMRKNNQEDFQNSFGVKLGFMSFFVKACVLGLKLYPSINAEVDNDHIVYKNYYNISFAVGTERGLVVPVLRDADELSFADIEKNIKAISEKAKDGNLTIEDLQGGTFTISNGGVYGSMLSTPILNPPQSGVLGMHNIIERPIVVEGHIQIRPVMYLALSYDHRIIDGKDSVSFLKTIKESLEEPSRLLLDI